MFHVHLPLVPPLAFPAFKEVAETNVWGRGGVSESETINLFYPDRKAVYRLLSWCCVCDQGPMGW